MPKPRLIWQGEYPIRTDEVDRHKILTLPALAFYLQVAAAQHARELGFVGGGPAEDWGQSSLGSSGK